VIRIRPTRIPTIRSASLHCGLSQSHAKSKPKFAVDVQPHVSTKSPCTESSVNIEKDLPKCRKVNVNANLMSRARDRRNFNKDLTNAAPMTYPNGSRTSGTVGLKGGRYPTVLCCEPEVWVQGVGLPPAGTESDRRIERHVPITRRSLNCEIHSNFVDFARFNEPSASSALPASVLAEEQSQTRGIHRRVPAAVLAYRL